MDAQSIRTSANVPESSQGIDAAKKIKGSYLEPSSLCPRRG